MNRNFNPPHPELVEGRGGSKAEHRALLADHRARLHAERGWWAAEVAMAHHPRIEGAGVVALYWPMRSELDPRPLMRRYLRSGWRVALPATPPRGVEAPLQFRLWDPHCALVTHAFGMQEPSADAEQVTPDVVIVPLLGFDGRGHRLGYGAGHYDRTLAGLRSSGPVTAIGFAFEGQRVVELPTHGGDQPLDAVLTEAGFHRFSKAQATG